MSLSTLLYFRTNIFIDLKSRNSPPYVKDLVIYENRMLNMVKNVKFRDVKCNFQKKLSSDVKNVKRNNGLIVPADKTTNFYKLDTKSYKKLLDKNITKTYKKTPAQTVKSIESSQSTSKQIAERLCIADRVSTTAKIEPFITLKDHKPNFQNNPTCRLINPCHACQMLGS